MRIGDQSPKEPPEKLPGSSEDQQKEVGKKQVHILNRLIFIICCAVIGFVGLNFISCNFMLPGSLNSANAEGKLKNPPPLECKESERRGYEVMLTLLTTVIALKTRIDGD